MSSRVSINADLSLSGLDYEHTWTAGDGAVCSAVDIGGFSIVFDSAADARAVAARCLKAADDIDAMAAEGAAKEGDIDG